MMNLTNHVQLMSVKINKNIQFFRQKTYWFWQTFFMNFYQQPLPDHY